MLLSFQKDNTSTREAFNLSNMQLSSAQLDTLHSGHSITIQIQTPSPSGSGYSIKQYVISLIGGIIIGVFTKLLHHWLPNWFPEHFNP
jgi:hypothetical protein